MKRERSLLLSAAAALLPLGLAIGQETHGESRHGSEGVGPAETGVVISVGFSGGSVEEYVEYVKQAVGGEAVVNIAMDEQVAAAKLPLLDLKQVSLEAAIRIIPSLGSGPFTKISVEVISTHPTPVYVLKSEPAWRPGSTPGGRALSTVLNAICGDEMLDGRTLPTLLEAIGSEKGTIAALLEGHKDKDVLEFFSLRGLVEGYPGLPQELKRMNPETILSAIEEVLRQKDTRGELPTLKFHADSNLLIMKGTREQIETVRKVLEKLGCYYQDRKAKVAEDFGSYLLEKEAMDVGLVEEDNELQSYDVLTRKGYAVKRQAGLADELKRAQAEIQKLRVMLEESQLEKQQLRLLHDELKAVRSRTEAKPEPPARR